MSKVKTTPDLSKIHFSGVSLPTTELWRTKDLALGQLKKSHQKLMQEVTKSREKLREKMKAKNSKESEFTTPILIPVLPNTVEEGSNLLIFQHVLKVPFQVIQILTSDYLPSC